MVLSIQAQNNSFRVAQFPGKGIVELKDDLWMRKGEPAFAITLDRIVEHVVDLHDAIMGECPVYTRNVRHGVTGPPDIAGTRAVFEFPV